MRTSRGEPTTKRIVFQRPGGELVIVSPAAPIPEGMSEAQYLTVIAQHAQACAALAGEPWGTDAVKVGAVEKHTLPADFRGITQRDGNGAMQKLAASAWRWDGSRVVIDLPLAREHKAVELIEGRRLNSQQAAALRQTLRNLTLEELRHQRV